MLPNLTLTPAQAAALIEKKKEAEALKQSGSAGTAARTAQTAAFNPGQSVWMRQGTIDARRSGRPIGTSGYPPAAHQVGPDVMGGDAYTAYDSRRQSAGLTPGQRESQAVFAQAIHEAEATRGLPNAALTMIPGHGYIVDPRRQGVNAVPTSAVSTPPALSPGLAPMGQRPFSPSFAGAGPVPNTFGGDRREALLNTGLQPAPQSAIPKAALDLVMGEAPRDPFVEAVLNAEKPLPSRALSGAPNAVYSFPQSSVPEYRQSPPPVNFVPPYLPNGSGAVRYKGGYRQPYPPANYLPPVLPEGSGAVKKSVLDARVKRAYEDLYGSSLTRDDLSRKLAVRKRKKKKK